MWHEDDALVLNDDAVAVEVPASWGAEVSHQLTFAGPLGPILAIPGRRLRWLFLASPEPEPAAYVLPPDVHYWHGPRRIPAVESRWVVPPATAALPPVGAVRCAIRTVRRSF